MHVAMYITMFLRNVRSYKATAIYVLSNIASNYVPIIFAIKYRKCTTTTKV